MPYDEIFARILKYHSLEDEKCPHCGLGYPERCKKCGNLIHCEPGDYEERCYTARCVNCGQEYYDPFWEKNESTNIGLSVWCWISRSLNWLTKKRKFS
jgi:hypothetical protein